jgi:hypothetical protein
MAGMFVPFMWSDSIEKAEKIVKNRGGGQLSTDTPEEKPRGRSATTRERLRFGRASRSGGRLRHAKPLYAPRSAPCSIEANSAVGGYEPSLG